MGDEQDEQRVSSIACEPCRQRKCKCDRAMPICSSCSVADPSRCYYTTGSKRGIPAGYLNSLETRLAQTEAALYQALNEIHSNHTDPRSNGEIGDLFKKRLISHKQDTAKEWRRLPLDTRDEVHRWWLERKVIVLQFPTSYDVMTSAATSSASPTTSLSGETSSRTPPTTQQSWMVLGDYNQGPQYQTAGILSMANPMHTSSLTASIPVCSYQSLPSTSSAPSFWQQQHNSLMAAAYEQAAYQPSSSALEPQQLPRHQYQQQQTTILRSSSGTRTPGDSHNHIYYKYS